RRNARARGRAESGARPAFVFCENSARFCQCNQQYLKPDFAKYEGERRPKMRFDLADLSLFRHVAEAGSITHGAERAHLALAAASTRIRNMEEALGAPLLVRSRHGISLTP